MDRKIFVILKLLLIMLLLSSFIVGCGKGSAPISNSLLVVAAWLHKIIFFPYLDWLVVDFVRFIHCILKKMELSLILARNSLKKLVVTNHQYQLFLYKN